MPWYALYTKSRFEKKVSLGLQALGITTYCPMVTTIRTWSDRKKKVELPLLPSYVFVEVEESERQRVFEVKGVVQYVFWLKKPAVIRAEEIEKLKKALTKTVTSFEVENKEIGDEIEITEGFFKGKKGTISALSKHKTTVILNDLGFKITFNYHDNENEIN